MSCPCLATPCQRRTDTQSRLDQGPLESLLSALCSLLTSSLARFKAWCRGFGSSHALLVRPIYSVLTEGIHREGSVEDREDPSGVLPFRFSSLTVKERSLHARSHRSLKKNRYRSIHQPILDPANDPLHIIPARPKSNQKQPKTTKSSDMPLPKRCLPPPFSSFFFHLRLVLVASVSSTAHRPHRNAFALLRLQQCTELTDSYSSRLKEIRNANAEIFFLSVFWKDWRNANG